MDITLHQIDKSNYEIVCDLSVTQEQEDYVAENMWSLVEAHYNSGYTCKAIYCDKQPVGFFMWVQESESKVSIWRFMIDQNYQQQGIGTKALDLALAQIKQTPNLSQIEICYNPENPVAKDFYSSFGFVEVGMDEDDEDMIAIIDLPLSEVA